MMKIEESKLQLNLLFINTFSDHISLDVDVLSYFQISVDNKPHVTICHPSNFHALQVEAAYIAFICFPKTFILGHHCTNSTLNSQLQCTHSFCIYISSFYLLLCSHSHHSFHNLMQPILFFT
jgi:hypothetical protein